MRHAVSAVRDFVGETIERIERDEETRAEPAGPSRPSEAAREAARARWANDPASLARRRELETKLPQAGLQTDPPEGQGEQTFLLPPRPADAPSGSEFMRSIAHLPPSKREEAVLEQIRSGNVPGHLRRGKTIELEHEGHRAEIQVMPDYLAIGSDHDFVRVPMTPRTAQALAGELGGALPTKNVVDAVWQQADVRLDPRPMTKERERVSTFAKHDALVRAQLERTGHQPGALVAGQKKDVVDSSLLDRRPDRVAIYGWHQTDGRPIQPLSTVHHAAYVDYSHGVRLLSDRMIVDGRQMSVEEVLADPELAGLLAR